MFSKISIGILTLGVISCLQGSRELEEEGTLQIEKSKPNILWIVADDLGTDLGCYGVPLVKTPNIDKLASQAIVFTNFHTVAAVCSPSRSALITGMYPVSINCHQHRTREEAKQKLPEGIKTLTEYFEENGYFTFNGSYENKEKPGKQDYNFLTDYKIYDGTDWSQREEGQPFFGQIQIHYPHRAFVHDSLNPIDQSKVKLPPYYPNHWVARQDWALYLETIQIVDMQVGKIMNRLMEEGLIENTYVFFVGDQGSPMVRHKQFLYDGGTNTPLIVRYPDGRHTDKKRHGLISNIDLAPTSLKLARIEIPSHIQGQNFLDEYQPRTELYTMRDRRDETVDRIRAIRTERYKYIRNFYPERPYLQYNAYKRYQYPVLPLLEVLKEQGKLTPEQEIFMVDKRPKEELYDLEQDPFELHNLAGIKEYYEVQSMLSSKLNEWILEADKGVYPEKREEIDFWEKRMAKHDSVWKGSRGLPVEVSNEQYLEWWKEYLKTTME